MAVPGSVALLLPVLDRLAEPQAGEAYAVRVGGRWYVAHPLRTGWWFGGWPLSHWNGRTPDEVGKRLNPFFCHTTCCWWCGEPDDLWRGAAPRSRSVEGCYRHCCELCHDRLEGADDHAGRLAQAWRG